MGPEQVSKLMSKPHIPNVKKKATISIWGKQYLTSRDGFQWKLYMETVHGNCCVVPKKYLMNETQATKKMEMDVWWFVV